MSFIKQLIEDFRRPVMAGESIDAKQAPIIRVPLQAEAPKASPAKASDDRG